MVVLSGGVWTNVEDEILKAAVSKYGKNQWARISSLLVRKAPKQCKARWYEWLDPGIKKVDWTREEDEKLLHLAKLLPTQWRTIAPIVGRTSTQCLERYQKLLDDAEAAESNELGLSGQGAESAPTADSVRKLRPGETDPDPETKPAKPDAIDMDEDEKEMLSEARARLANTQGKKAKRKQREKLLEETKRLSVLQKRRDLKGAGVTMKLHHRKKGEMDYNADIPFEHKPALGFYDTTEEMDENEKLRQGTDYAKINQKLQDDAAAAEERRTGKKREADADKKPQITAASLEKLKKAEQLTKRRKLNLPGPQVSDRELEEIVKLGQSSRTARDLADGDAGAQGLLGEYDSVQTGQVARTPRTPAMQDNINLEARNLRALTSTQSSLLGAENTPLHGGQQGTGYDGATPRRQAAPTPSSHDEKSLTAQTPLRTPQRDNLRLNNEPSESNQVAIVDEQRLAKQKAAELRSLFADLPAPKNDYELELPEDEEDAIALEEDVEDAAERDARNKKIKEEEELILFKQRSSVIQRGLPRPKHIDATELLEQAKQKSGAERLIAEEMARLIVSDAVKYPLPAARVSGRASVITDIELVRMDAARALIAEETVPHDTEERVEAAPTLSYLQTVIPQINDKLQEDAISALKLEKKLALVLGGYQKRATLLSTKFKEAVSALQQAHIAMNSFEVLEENETSAIVTRTETLREEVARLEKINASGQAKYSSLSARKEALMAV